MLSDFIKESNRNNRQIKKREKLKLEGDKENGEIKRKNRKVEDEN
jgi:hypothetical protein